MSSRVVSPFEFWAQNPVCTDLNSDTFENYDSLVVVASDLNDVTVPASNYLFKFLDLLKAHKETDAAFGDVESFIALPDSQSEKIRKMVYSPTGPLNRDYDDVRRYADAARNGMKRILKSGAIAPLLIVFNDTRKFLHSELVSILGASDEIYVPLEVREAVPNKLSKVHKFGFSSSNGSSAFIARVASAIERGRTMCRDIGGSDPERMAAPNVALYVQEMFANTCINVEVIESEAIIQKEYPLLAAVNRAARGINRHCARVIHLTYEPEEPHDMTLVLVGKGVTYDTGGADVKYGGHMAGMHRDKCGAAAVAGFFQTLAVLKPKAIRVIGAMAMVRNSIGPDSYVSDEIITSRAGVRIRIGNTDAEGRMAMGDVLCHLKEKVLNEKNAYLFTIATLTGHACLAVGDGYSIVMENGPAKAARIGNALHIAGEEIGDNIERSNIRREDYEFHAGKSVYEDLLQCNNLPSSQTPRGHISPAAFLIVASGLDKHGIDSPRPLKYCHIDIAASSGPFPGIPSGSPIAALTKQFLMN